MESTNRRYDIDWLRVIAFYLLIFYHVGMVFVPWEFHIKNTTTSEWFETWMAFLSQWRLPLLFMISGIVIYYSLGKRTAKGFLKERAIRLLIPLLFGMFVIVPPQIYVERISNGVQFANYWEFWKTIFNFVPYPLGGSLSWHHLWYVLYIFVYSVIALPIFIYLRSERSDNFKNKITNFVKKNPNSIYLIFIPFLIFYFSLARAFPTTHALIDDLYNHSISFTVFLFGFFIASIDGFWDAITLKRKQSLIMAVVPATLLILFLWGPTFEIPFEEADWFIYLYGIFKWTFITSWLLAILGYAKVFLNKPSKVISYANESVYPFYILHQTVELIFAYYVVQLNWGILPKFALLVVITFGGSLLIYELLIKRYSITRLLFGMKPKKSERKINVEVSEKTQSTNFRNILNAEFIKNDN